uniref:RING-type E3 ubiquitin transferase n=1 Tax=Branchiostoma floridae TaxID=7739 RepID=C3XR71_BRAFL|eukprot:XP_002613180.1 hypothetical protein BRAFLDRAFT_73101 [Branchiostoma floridae]
MATTQQYESKFRQQMREEFLSCSICTDTFKKPKVLPCQHTFCSTCLRDWAETRKPFQCPMCRVSVDLPAQGVSGFQDNRLVAGLCEQFSDKLSTSPPKAEQRNQGKCYFHPGQDIALFCQQCKMPACNHCVNERHTGHTFWSVEEGAFQRKDVFASLITDSHRFRETIVGKLQHLEHGEKRLNQQKKEADEGVARVVADAIAQLRSSEKVLLSEIDENYRQNLGPIKQKHNALLAQVAQLTEACDAARLSLSQGGREALGQEAALHKMLSRYRTDPSSQLAPIQAQVVTFQPATIDLRNQKLGNLSLQSFTLTPQTGGYQPPLSPGPGSPTSPGPGSPTSPGPRLTIPGIASTGATVSRARNNEVYITDKRNCRILVYNLQGAHIRHFTTSVPGAAGTEVMGPDDVEEEEAGNLWVVGVIDKTRDQLAVQYAKDCSFVSKIDLKLKYPSSSLSIAVNKKKNYIVLPYDVSRDAVNICKPNGSTVRHVGGGKHGVKHASGFAVNNDGNIYISDDENHSIFVYDGKGKFLFKFGSYGTGDGQMNQPRGVCTDTSGNVVVADTGNRRVELFDAKGTFLRHISANMNAPVAVAVGQHGQLVISDIGNNAISVFDRY